MPVEMSFDRLNSISEGTYTPATLSSYVISPELQPYVEISSQVVDGELKIQEKYTFTEQAYTDLLGKSSTVSYTTTDAQGQLSHTGTITLQWQTAAPFF